MELSKIQWTDHTFNPWVGCTKVSPGCAHCYAEMLMDVRYKRVKWGMGNPRSRNGAEYWKKPLRWNAVQWGQCGCGYRGPVENGCPDCKTAEGMVPARQRVFCASLGDWLDDEVPEEWLADLLGLIHATPNLDWLLLTKRPENFQTRIKSVLLWLAEVQKTYCSDEHGWLSDWRHGVKAPHNVWIGASVEDQQRAKERIPELLGIPARVRFLSCEPLLGDVDIRKVPAVMILAYSVSTARATSGVDPLVILRMVVSVLTLSPGLMRSGL